MKYAILQTLISSRVTRNQCYPIISRTPKFLILQKMTAEGPEEFRVHITRVFVETDYDISAELVRLNDEVQSAFSTAQQLKELTASRIKYLATSTLPRLSVL